MSSAAFRSEGDTPRSVPNPAGCGQRHCQRCVGKGGKRKARLKRVWVSPWRLLSSLVRGTGDRAVVVLTKDGDNRGNSRVSGLQSKRSRLEKLRSNASFLRCESERLTRRRLDLVSGAKLDSRSPEGKFTTNTYQPLRVIPTYFVVLTSGGSVRVGFEPFLV